MGRGFCFVCKSCGKAFTECLGVGFMYPKVYRDTMKAAREGTLGLKVKQFVTDNPQGAIDPKIVIAQCEKCGNYEAVPDLSMYIPKNGNDPMIHRGNWTVGDRDNETEYVFEFDQYDLINKYEHRCSSCGGRMQVLQDQEPESLKCPECGDDMIIQEEIMWD